MTINRLLLWTFHKIFKDCKGMFKNGINRQVDIIYHKNLQDIIIMNLEITFFHTRYT